MVVVDGLLVPVEPLFVATAVSEPCERVSGETMPERGDDGFVERTGESPDCAESSFLLDDGESFSFGAVVFGLSGSRDCGEMVSCPAAGRGERGDNVGRSASVPQFGQNRLSSVNTSAHFAQVTWRSVRDRVRN